MQDQTHEHLPHDQEGTGHGGGGGRYQWLKVGVSEIEVWMDKEKHTRRLNEVCIGIFKPGGMRAVMPLSMTRFNLFPVGSN